MAVTVIAQINANIVGLTDPADVENDATAAAQGTVNVHVPSLAGNSGFLTLEPEAAALLGIITTGPCTIFVTQGAGAVTVNPTQ